MFSYKNECSENELERGCSPWAGSLFCIADGAFQTMKPDHDTKISRNQIGGKKKNRKRKNGKKLEKK